MSRWRCESCKGEYTDPAPDGVRYFHTCPPLVDPETGEEKLRPMHRDERPADVAIVAVAEGYLVLGAGAEVLSKSTTAPEVPMRAKGAGREAV